MPDHLSFGYWVRRRRKALDLTQADLGRLVGASAAMIRKIEAEERRPSRELADLLAKHLAVSAAERESFLRAARDIATVESLVPPIGAANAASIGTAGPSGAEDQSVVAEPVDTEDIVPPKEIIIKGGKLGSNIIFFHTYNGGDTRTY